MDELGDARLAIHCPLGRRVLHPLALVLERRVTETRGVMPPLSVSDDGLLLRLDGDDNLGANPFALLAGIDVERALLETVALTALFGARFRDNAARALVLGGPTAGKVLASLAWSVAFLVVFAPLAVRRYRAVR